MFTVFASIMILTLLCVAVYLETDGTTVSPVLSFTTGFAVLVFLTIVYGCTEARSISSDKELVIQQLESEPRLKVLIDYAKYDMIIKEWKNVKQ